jgi:hypothetical protein
MADSPWRLMRSRIVSLKSALVGVGLALAIPFTGAAKGYSSGGHSYSSQSSHSSSGSHSFSSGSGHSFSSGPTRTSSSSSSSSSKPSSTKTFSSGGGKSYTSGSTSMGDRKGYSSSKSYSSGSGINFSSGSGKRSPASSSISKPSSSDSSGLNFDTAAARARKEEASRSEFSRFKDSQKPPVIPGAGNNSYAGRPPPIPSRSYGRTVYVPDYTVIRTRPSRINIYFGPYAYRPWTYYNDPYSSFFWWWLLDRSIDEQAYWAYHHRYDMDPARYDALLANNQQLQARVANLEAQQVGRDPAYTPPSLDATNRDLMYSDQYVNQAYQTRSTPSGRVAFWIFAVPTCAGACAFFIWLIWFKRWQSAVST